MLYDKIATVYTVSRNSKMVSSWIEWDTFNCNIQPMGSSNGFGSSPVYNQYKMYTDNMSIKEWDKTVCGTDTYIVKDAENRDWAMRTFNKVTLEKSRWT